MAAKLKTVPQKASFDAYISKYKYKGDARHVFSAYSDCLPEHVDTDGIERNLKYISLESFNVQTATEILKLAIPSGYNGFEAEKCLKDIAAVFGAESRILIARENSVCLYIKPAQGVWFGRGDLNFESLADEVSFESELGMFRLWWD